MIPTGALLRRLSLALGGLMLASVAAELIVASSDNSLSLPAGRFQAIAAAIPRLVQIVAGLGLVGGAIWASDQARAPKRAGWVMLVFAVLLLIPPVVMANALGPATAGLGPGGVLRARVQLGRAVVVFLTLSAMLLLLGRFLLSRSRQLAAEQATK